jgi:predicted Co/Zn/Cd cation transporter (cation efflux family)
MVMKSIDDFKKRYLPTHHEAEQVARMNQAEYIEWFFKTPRERRDKVIKELHHIAQVYKDKARHIFYLMGC